MRIIQKSKLSMCNKSENTCFKAKNNDPGMHDNRENTCTNRLKRKIGMYIALKTCIKFKK